MSIFGSIKDAIFGRAAQAATPPAAAAQAAIDAVASVNTAAAAASEPVDVEATLNAIDGSQNLNWRSSIVDLMKLIGVDSSLDNRKSLAQELGYTGALDGSAEMNLWLHKQTLKALADNGGKVPAELLA